MDLRLISTPLTRFHKLAVVPIAEVKRDARILHADEDEVVADDIEAAYDFLSGPNGWLNGCCLLEEEWELFLPSTLCASFDLPLRPIAGATLTGFGWLQADGSYVDVEPALFGLTTWDGAGRVRRLLSRPWPYRGLVAPRAYRVRFKAGFGTSRESIPSPLRKAIRMLAAHWFVNRETVAAEGRKAGEEIRYGLQALARRWRVPPDHS